MQSVHGCVAVRMCVRACECAQRTKGPSCITREMMHAKLSNRKKRPLHCANARNQMQMCVGKRVCSCPTFTVANISTRTYLFECIHFDIRISTSTSASPHARKHARTRVRVYTHGARMHALAPYPQTETHRAPVARSDIAWNFEKFVIDKSGKPRIRLSHFEPPVSHFEGVFVYIFIRMSIRKSFHMDFHP